MNGPFPLATVAVAVPLLFPQFAFVDDGVMAGTAFTVIVCVAFAEQPTVLVTVTV